MEIRKHHQPHWSFYKRYRKTKRSGENRRKLPYNLDYFFNGGKERRIGNANRRLTPDHRMGWWNNSR
jgi:hypothetical protein